MPPTAGTSSARPCSMAERARLAKVAQPEAALKCPRCDSTNTKFCYFNNYSLSQPRHFCKTCRRYWTRGGALRNVPVGGGCRRNKRSKSTGSGGGGSRNSGGSSAGGGGAITPSFQPPPQLPFMAPLQHLVDYEMHFPVDTVDFQLGGRGGWAWSSGGSSRCSSSSLSWQGWSHQQRRRHRRPPWSCSHLTGNCLR
ncbi:unnamed protein product [Spirodela intermedia]|uniref:Dof zinc finger protein n=1 Tax=Spirodela intermedia TaxID=51605 RepID=A0A7I8IG29_SPIIN|nr:unnamed protein product [Spirodela intermedia]CAA6656819.1 unnamed protein product [Spirodela intermedia]